MDDMETDSSVLEASPVHEDTSTDHVTSHVTSRRTADQVSISAKAAGLTGTTGPIQLLHFSTHLNSDDVKLLEMPIDVLRALKQGEKYVVMF